MDFDEYVAARHGTLLRTAVLLGCPEADAPRVVGRVLAASARRITRAQDPDPEVYDALVAAIPGARESRLGTADPLLRQQLVMSAAPVEADYVGGEPPPRQPPAWQLLPVAVALLLLLGAAAVVGPATGVTPPAPSPSVLARNQVPSLFGYDAEDARALLATQDLRTVEQPARACELAGRVLGSDPPAGSTVPPGVAITIRTAVPSDSTCLAEYVERAAAWRFLDFATGRGPAPDFASTVYLIVDRADPTSLSGEQAARRSSWGRGSVLDALAEASRQVERIGSTYEVPTLTVYGGVPPDTFCGVPRPPQTGPRNAVTMQIALPSLAGDPTRCPVTVSLYSSSRGIDSIIFYAARDEPG